MITTRLSKRSLAAVAAGAAATLLVAGCGSNDNASSSPAPSASASATATPSGVVTQGADTTPTSTCTSNSILVPCVKSSVQQTGGLGIAQENVFSVLSPWNTPIGSSPLESDFDSQRALDLAQIRTSVDANGHNVQNVLRSGVYINTTDWTDAVVAGGVPTTLTCRQLLCGDGGADIQLDVPTNVSPDPLYDGWFTIFDESTGKAYDLWRARREDDGTISYNYMRIWDLNGTGYLRPYEVSARGSGLPLFAGLIRRGELQSGEIDHALAISLPAPSKTCFVQPASSTDGTGQAGAVPEGARIVLKRSFHLAPPVVASGPQEGKRLPFDRTQQRYAQTIVRALQTYGAIIVDRAAVPTLYMERTGDDGTGTANTAAGNGDLSDNNSGTISSNVTGTTATNRNQMIAGYELSSLKLSDFNVVAQGANQQCYPYPRRTTDVSASGLAGVGTPTGSGSDVSEEGQ